VWGMSLVNGAVAKAFRCTGAGCGELKIPLAVWCVRGGAGPDGQ
jgi:hypothetical protein